MTNTVSQTCEVPLKLKLTSLTANITEERSERKTDIGEGRRKGRERKERGTRMGRGENVLTEGDLEKSAVYEVCRKPNGHKTVIFDVQSHLQC
jgi:hypothetical protein